MDRLAAMPKRLLPILLTLSLTACSKIAWAYGPFYSYLALSDEMIVATWPISMWFTTTLRCQNLKTEQRDSGILIEQCFKMLPAQRWHGLVIVDEDPVFLPDAAKAPEYRTHQEPWLDFVHPEEKIPLRRWDERRVYEVEFVGRRTVYQGHYGQGGSEHHFLVDHLVSAKLIE